MKSVNNVDAICANAFLLDEFNNSCSLNNPMNDYKTNSHNRTYIIEYKTIAILCQDEHSVQLLKLSL